MPYNVRDVAGFPPPSQYREIDWQSLCDLADPTKVIPVSYAFGGASPDAIVLSDGSQLRSSGIYNATRMFVEFTPYYWNPASPDWNGQ